MTNPTDDLVFGLRGVASLVGVSHETVREMVADGRLPKPIAPGRRGRAAVWRKSDLDGFRRAAPRRRPGVALRKSSARVCDAALAFRKAFLNARTRPSANMIRMGEELDEALAALYGRDWRAPVNKGRSD